MTRLGEGAGHCGAAAAPPRAAGARAFGANSPRGHRDSGGGVEGCHEPRGSGYPLGEGGVAPPPLGRGQGGLGGPTLPSERPAVKKKAWLRLLHKGVHGRGTIGETGAAMEGREWRVGRTERGKMPNEDHRK